MKITIEPVDRIIEADVECEVERETSTSPGGLYWEITNLFIDGKEADPDELTDRERVDLEDTFNRRAQEQHEEAKAYHEERHAREAMCD